MSGFNFNEVFGPKAAPKPKRKPIVYHNIKAPDANSTSPGSYVRFELVPQYNGLTQYYEVKPWRTARRGLKLFPCIDAVKLL